MSVVRLDNFNPVNVMAGGSGTGDSSIFPVWIVVAIVVVAIVVLAISNLRR